MGKIKRNQRARTNPLSRNTPTPSSSTSNIHAKTNQLQDADEKNMRQTQIAPVMERLQQEGSARNEGLTIIAALADDSSFRKLLLKERLLKVLLEQCLPDPSMEIKTKTLGVLQTVCVEEGYETGIFLYRNKILDVIEQCLAKIRDELQAQSHTLDPEFIQYTYGLLGALAACDETIFEEISERFLPELGTVTTKLVEEITSTSPNQGASVQSTLLDTICEASSILSESNESLLSSLSAQTMERVLAWPQASFSTKIFVNYFLLNVVESWLSQSAEPEEVERAMSNILVSVMTCVRQQMSMDQLKEAVDQTDLSSLLHSSGKGSENINLLDLSLSSEFRTIHAKFAHAREVINAAQTSLELLAAVAQTYEVGFGGSGGLSSQSAADGEASAVGGSTDNPDDLEQGENETDQEYFDRMIDRAEQKRRMLDMPTDIDFSSESKKAAASRDGAAPTPSTSNDASSNTSILDILNNQALPWAVQCLSVVETRPMAMTALNNITWTLSTELSVAANPTWSNHAKELWINLINQLLGQGNDSNSMLETADIETLCGCVGTLGAVAATFKGHVPREVNGILVIPALVGTCEKVKHSFANDTESLSQYIEKAIDVLTSLTLATSQDASIDSSSEEHPAAIVGYLLVDEILSSAENTPVSLLVKSLDAVYDVFGDAEYVYDGPVFANRQYLEKLQQLLPIIRKIAKHVDKKKNPELRAVVDEAISNLGRFIQYKKEERR